MKKSTNFSDVYSNPEKYPTLIEINVCGMNGFQMKDLTEIEQKKNLLTSLERINASDNIISKVILRGIQTLKNLLLERNMISEVALNLPNLLELNLSYNFLSKVPNLSNLPKLQILNLSSNLIEKVNCQDFTSVKQSLKELFLGFNKIKFEAQTFIAFIEGFKLFNIESLSLEGNDFIEENKSLTSTYKLYVVASLPMLAFFNEEKILLNRENLKAEELTYQIITLDKDINTNYFKQLEQNQVPSIITPTPDQKDQKQNETASLNNNNNNTDKRESINKTSANLGFTNNLMNSKSAVSKQLNNVDTKSYLNSAEKENKFEIGNNKTTPLHRLETSNFNNKLLPEFYQKKLTFKNINDTMEKLILKGGKDQTLLLLFFQMTNLILVQTEDLEFLQAEDNESKNQIIEKTQKEYTKFLINCLSLIELNSGIEWSVYEIIGEFSLFREGIYCQKSFDFYESLVKNSDVRKELIVKVLENVVVKRLASNKENISFSILETIIIFFSNTEIKFDILYLNLVSTILHQFMNVNLQEACQPSNPEELKQKKELLVCIEFIVVYLYIKFNDKEKFIDANELNSDDDMVNNSNNNNTNENNFDSIFNPNNNNEDQIKGKAFYHSNHELLNPSLQDKKSYILYNKKKIKYAEENKKLNMFDLGYTDENNQDSSINSLSDSENDDKNKIKDYLSASLDQSSSSDYSLNSEELEKLKLDYSSNLFELERKKIKLEEVDEMINKCKKTIKEKKVNKKDLLTNLLGNFNDKKNKNSMIEKILSDIDIENNKKTRKDNSFEVEQELRNNQYKTLDDYIKNNSDIFFTQHKKKSKNSFTEESLNNSSSLERSNNEINDNDDNDEEITNALQDPKILSDDVKEINIFRLNEDKKKDIIKRFKFIFETTLFKLSPIFMRINYFFKANFENLDVLEKSIDLIYAIADTFKYHVTYLNVSSNSADKLRNKISLNDSSVISKIEEFLKPLMILYINDTNSLDIFIIKEYLKKQNENPNQIIFTEEEHNKIKITKKVISKLISCYAYLLRITSDSKFKFEIQKEVCEKIFTAFTLSNNDPYILNGICEFANILFEDNRTTSDSLIFGKIMTKAADFKILLIYLDTNEIKFKNLYDKTLDKFIRRNINYSLESMKNTTMIHLFTNITSIFKNLASFTQKDSAIKEIVKGACADLMEIKMHELIGNLLKVRDDNVRKAVVEFFYFQDHKNITSRVVSQILTIIANFNSVTIGETEIILSVVYTIFNKMVLESSKTLEERDNFNVIMSNSIKLAMNFLIKNCDRNPDSREEIDQKNKLSSSLILFINTCGKIPQIFSSIKAETISQINTILLYDYIYYNKDFYVPLEIERSNFFNQCQNIFELTRGNSPVLPYSWVFVRVMIKLADLLCNFCEITYNSDYTEDLDNLLDNLKNEIDLRVKLKISNETLDWNYIKTSISEDVTNKNSLSEFTTDIKRNIKKTLILQNVLDKFVDNVTASSDSDFSNIFTNNKLILNDYPEEEFKNTNLNLDFLKMNIGINKKLYEKYKNNTNANQSNKEVRDEKSGLSYVALKNENNNVYDINDNWFNFKMTIMSDKDHNKKKKKLDDNLNFKAYDNLNSNNMSNNNIDSIDEQNEVIFYLQERKRNILYKKEKTGNYYKNSEFKRPTITELILQHMNFVGYFNNLIMYLMGKTSNLNEHEVKEQLKPKYDQHILNSDNIYLVLRNYFMLEDLSEIKYSTNLSKKFYCYLSCKNEANLSSLVNNNYLDIKSLITGNSTVVGKMNEANNKSNIPIYSDLSMYFLLSDCRAFKRINKDKEIMNDTQILGDLKWISKYGLKDDAKIVKEEENLNNIHLRSILISSLLRSTYAVLISPSFLVRNTFIEILFNENRLKNLILLSHTASPHDYSIVDKIMIIYEKLFKENNLYYIIKCFMINKKIAPQLDSILNYNEEKIFHSFYLISLSISKLVHYYYNKNLSFEEENFEDKIIQNFREISNIILAICNFINAIFSTKFKKISQELILEYLIKNIINEKIIKLIIVYIKIGYRKIDDTNNMLIYQNSITYSQNAKNILNKEIMNIRCQISEYLLNFCQEVFDNNTTIFSCLSSLMIFDVNIKFLIESNIYFYFSKNEEDIEELLIKIDKINEYREKLHFYLHKEELENKKIIEISDKKNDSLSRISIGSNKDKSTATPFASSILNDNIIALNKLHAKKNSQYILNNMKVIPENNKSNEDFYSSDEEINANNNCVNKSSNMNKLRSNYDIMMIKKVSEQPLDNKTFLQSIENTNKIKSDILLSPEETFELVFKEKEKIYNIIRKSTEISYEFFEIAISNKNLFKNIKTLIGLKKSQILNRLHESYIQKKNEQFINNKVLSYNEPILLYDYCNLGFLNNYNSCKVVIIITNKEIRFYEILPSDNEAFVRDLMQIKNIKNPILEIKIEDINSIFTYDYSNRLIFTSNEYMSNQSEDADINKKSASDKANKTNIENKQKSKEEKNKNSNEIFSVSKEDIYIRKRFPDFSIILRSIKYSIRLVELIKQMRSEINLSQATQTKNKKRKNDNETQINSTKIEDKTINDNANEEEISKPIRIIQINSLFYLVQKIEVKNFYILQISKQKTHHNNKRQAKELILEEDMVYKDEKKRKIWNYSEELYNLQYMFPYKNNIYNNFYCLKNFANRYNIFYINSFNNKSFEGAMASFFTGIGSLTRDVFNTNNNKSKKEKEKNENYSNNIKEERYANNSMETADKRVLFFSNYYLYFFTENFEKMYTAPGEEFISYNTSNNQQYVDNIYNLEIKIRIDSIICYEYNKITNAFRIYYIDMNDNNTSKLENKHLLMKEKEKYLSYVFSVSHFFDWIILNNKLDTIIKKNDYEDFMISDLVNYG